MRTTIDSAGRIVVPKALRDEVGLIPGEVEVHVLGNRIILEVPSRDDFVERDGIQVIPGGGQPISDDDVRDLLELGRR